MARTTRTGRHGEAPVPAMAKGLARDEAVGPRGERPEAAAEMDRQQTEGVGVCSRLYLRPSLFRSPRSQSTLREYSGHYRRMTSNPPPSTYARAWDPIHSAWASRWTIHQGEGGVLVLDIPEDMTAHGRKRVPGGVLPSAPRWKAEEGGDGG